MSDVANICGGHHVPGVKVNPKDPKAVKDAKDIQVLAGLEKLFEAKDAIIKTNKEIDALLKLPKKKGGLSKKGKRVLGKFFGPKYKGLRFSERFGKAATDASRTKDIRLLIRMKKIAEAAELKVGNIIKSLSSLFDKDVYTTISAKGPGPEAVKLAMNLLMDKLSTGLKAKVNSAKSAGTEIRGLCVDVKKRWKPPRVVRPRVVKPRDVKPKIEKPKVTPPPPWYVRLHSHLEYSFRAGSAYGHRLSGRDNLETLANENRGAVPQGGVSVKYKIKRNLAVQADYNGEEPFGVTGEDKKYKVLSAMDFGRLSAIYDSKKVSVVGQAGWLAYKNLYPSRVTEDKNVFVQGLRVNYRPTSKYPLSVNIDQWLNAGWINQTFPEDKQVTLRAVGQVGLSWAFKLKKDIRIIPFAGGTGGYYLDRKDEDKGAVYGGYAGAAFIHGNHEANLRGDYNNVNGVLVRARYFYNTKKWGVGAQLFYNLISKKLNGLEESQHLLGAMITARVKLFKLFGNGFELRPFVQSGYEVDSGASNILAGLIIRFGELPSVTPPQLRPDTINAFPEEK